jgi:hypothetical protein
MAIVLAGGFDGELLTRLGARVITFEGALDDERATDWARSHAPLNALVYDAAGPFASGGLRAALDGAWEAVRAIATGALIPSGQGGRIVLQTPRPDAADHADAARAALENLSRTLSIEWARYGITTVAITPGVRTSSSDLGSLVAFLLSPAGAYFSGCRFELGAISATISR